MRHRTTNQHLTVRRSHVMIHAKIVPTQHVLLRIFSFLLPVLTLQSCDVGRKDFVIGVSQCSEDSWRKQLTKELEMSTYFNDNISVSLAFANDDDKRQMEQIDSLVNEGIDLLIVSPNQEKTITPAINAVMKKGIPVILFDRKTEETNYTAFMGADNYLIGQMLGKYIVSKLDGRGYIMEIGGLKGSSPAIERHRGFRDVIGRYPDLHVVGYGEGDWKEASGEKVMAELLKSYDGPIDCVFAGNDRMAVGARKAMQQRGLPVSNTIFAGVDALSIPGAGIEQVRDGILTVSALYPTRGDKLMQLAINILTGQKYDRITMMPSALVTVDNAEILLQQADIINDQSDYLKSMHSRINVVLSTVSTQRIMIFCIIVFVLIISILLAFSIKEIKARHRLNKALNLKNEELNREKELAEQRRDELEVQRDKLIEATMTDQDMQADPEHTVSREAEFMHRLTECIEQNYSDSNFSVEAIGQTLFLSRMQIYRKVKSITGKSPVEMIRDYRLNKARHLLRTTTLSVSEVAYRVGFTSPSYFTKCYKTAFGHSPTEMQQS